MNQVLINQMWMRCQCFAECRTGELKAEHYSEWVVKVGGSEVGNLPSEFPGNVTGLIQDK